MFSPIPWLFAVMVLTLRLMVRHWSIRHQKVVHRSVAKIHLFHADIFAVFECSHIHSLEDKEAKQMEENKSNELTLKVWARFYVAVHENSYSNTVQNEPWDKKHWWSPGLIEC